MFGCQGSLQGVEFKITWRFHSCPLFVCMIVNGFFECQCYTRQGHRCRTSKRTRERACEKALSGDKTRTCWPLAGFVWSRYYSYLSFPFPPHFCFPASFPTPMSIVQTFDHHCNLDDGKVINDPIHVRGMPQQGESTVLMEPNRAIFAWINTR